jgi:hypothetical protein
MFNTRTASTMTKMKFFELKFHVQDREGTSLPSVESRWKLKMCVSANNTRKKRDSKFKLNKCITSKHRSCFENDDKANDETSLTGWGFLFLSYFRGIIPKMTFVCLFVSSHSWGWWWWWRKGGMLRNVEEEQI